MRRPLPPPTVPEEPAWLLGTWRFERVVDDRRAGRTLHANGTATFAEVRPGHVTWDEEGSLLLDDAPVEIAAHRVLRRGPAGSWAVEFADGRPFHEWAVGAEVVHDCPPDDYRGLVEADPEGAGWTQTWRVVGPAKDYTMTTSYTRQAAR